MSEFFFAQVSESVQQFRAIISRINGDSRPAKGNEPDAANTQCSNSRMSVPRIPQVKDLNHFYIFNFEVIYLVQENQFSSDTPGGKPCTWPIPVRPSPYRPIDLVRIK